MLQVFLQSVTAINGLVAGVASFLCEIRDGIFQVSSSRFFYSGFRLMCTLPLVGVVKMIDAAASSSLN